MTEQPTGVSGGDAHHQGGHSSGTHSEEFHKAKSPSLGNNFVGRPYHTFDAGTESS
jgi:hypothetical protein